MEERSNAAALECKRLSDRIKVLEEGQAAFEKTFLAKCERMSDGYKLMIQLHTFFIEQHNKFLEELKARSDELTNKKI